MAVSKKLRFEIFRRDNFQCRYCGRSAQDGAYLEPDHVVPRARGGLDVATNLVTACDECNAGKSDTPLQARPIEDVPQDTFRRVCAERGISDVPLADGVSENSTLSSEIRGLYGDDEWNELTEGELRWISEDDPAPDPDELQISVAYAAFLDERLMRARFETAVELLLDLHPERENVDHCRRATWAELDNNPHLGKRTPRTTLLLVATRFLQQQHLEYFCDLPEEQRAEWLEWAEAQDAAGRTGWLADLEPDPRALLRKAAEAAHLTKVGYTYGKMCGGRGRVINDCPKVAAFRVWMDGCSHCEPAAASHAEGHRYCEEHVEKVKAAGLIKDRFRFRTAEPITVEA